MFQDKQVKEQKGKLIELSTLINRQNKENEKIEKIEGLFHKLKISFEDYQQLNIAKLLSEIKVDQLYRQTLLELKIILKHPENKRSYIWNKDYEINDENIKSFLTIHKKRKDDSVKNKSITKVVIGKNLGKIKLNPTRLEEIENKLNLLKKDIFNDKNTYAFNNYGFTPQEIEIMQKHGIIQFMNTGGMFKYITDKTVTEVAKLILFNLDKQKKVLAINDPVYVKKVLDFLEWLYYETVNSFVNPKICEKLLENNLPKKYSKAVHELGLVHKEGKNYYKWVNAEKVPEKSDAILVIEKERELSGEYRKNRRKRIADEKNTPDKKDIFILDISGPIPPKPNTQVESKIETLNSVLIDCVKEEKEALEAILNQHPEFTRWQKLNTILNSI
jgi:hypothetical protein